MSLDVTGYKIEDLAELGTAALVRPTEEEPRDFKAPLYNAAISVNGLAMIEADYAAKVATIEGDAHLTPQGKQALKGKLTAETAAEAQKIAGGAFARAQRTLGEAEAEASRIVLPPLDHFEAAMIPAILARLAALDPLEREVELRRAVADDDRLTVAVALRAPRALGLAIRPEAAAELRAALGQKLDPQAAAQLDRMRELTRAAERRLARIKRRAGAPDAIERLARGNAAA
jgi:hypothetical protein